MLISKISPRNVSEIAKLKSSCLRSLNQSQSSIVQPLPQGILKLQNSNHQAGPGVLAFAEAPTSQQFWHQGVGL